MAQENIAIPVPKGLKYSISADDSPERILSAFLGIPYRVDGVIDENGHYTFFSSLDVSRDSPGLNCSGFVLSASRFLLKNTISVEPAMKDRLGDSGISSPYGKDWDFGWDLILNITEGLSGTFILPDGERLDRSDAAITGFAPRGFDLHAPKTWPELAQRLKPGFIYFVSFNKDVSKRGYKMQHYHVALIHVNNSGEINMYQTTSGSRKVYRRNLANKKQRETFLRSFANAGRITKYLLILEVPLP